MDPVGDANNVINRTGIRLKVYVSVPVTDKLPEDSPYVAAIRDVFDKKGYDVHLASEFKYAADDPWAAAADLFLEEQRMIGVSDVVVAYAPRGSTGVGVSIQVSQACMKPLILVGNGISRMASHVAGGQVKLVCKYDLESLGPQIRRIVDSITSDIVAAHLRTRLRLKTVGRRLRALREEKGWQQHEAAAKLGIEAPLYRYLEEGTFMPLSLALLTRIADAYDLDMCELILSESDLERSEDRRLFHSVAYDHVPEYRVVADIFFDVVHRRLPASANNAQRNRGMSQAEVKSLLRCRMLELNLHFDDIPRGGQGR